MLKLLILVILAVGVSAESASWVAHTTKPVKIATDNFSAVCVVTGWNLTASTVFQWNNGTNIKPKTNRYTIQVTPLTTQTLDEVLNSNFTSGANVSWTQLDNATTAWQEASNAAGFYAQILISKIAVDEVDGLLCASVSSLPVEAYAYAKRGAGMKESKNVIQGDEYCLTCEAYGSPLPETIDWYKNGKPLVTDGRVTLERTENKTMNATLRFNPVEYIDEAVYSCYTENKHGRSENITMSMQVKDRWAALWPFIGIVIEVIVLCAIILLYEKRQQRKLEEEDDKDQSTLMNDGAANEKDEHDGVPNGDDVRQRPIVKS